MKSANWMDSFSTPAATPAPRRVRWMDTVLTWLERSRQRNALGRLDERLLADMGCDRASAAAEADKPFWRK